mgnify:CR=1 FL=1
MYYHFALRHFVVVKFVPLIGKLRFLRPADVMSPIRGASFVGDDSEKLILATKIRSRERRYILLDLHRRL